MKSKISNDLNQTTLEYQGLLNQCLLLLDTMKDSLEPESYLSIIFHLRQLVVEIKPRVECRDYYHGYLENLRLLSDLGSYEVFQRKEKHADANFNNTETTGSVVL